MGIATNLDVNHDASNMSKALTHFSDTHIFLLIGTTAWAGNFP